MYLECGHVVYELLDLFILCLLLLQFVTLPGQNGLHQNRKVDIRDGGIQGLGGGLMGYKE